MVWRDHSRDYGKDLSLTVPLDVAASGTVTATSGASYAVGTLASESIGALFGSDMATSALSATATPLPTTLGGVSVELRDGAGVNRSAPLFYVSPTQITFQVPAGSSSGAATLRVTRGGTVVGQGSLTIDSVTPGLFTANSDGRGVPAAIAIRAKTNGVQTDEPVLQLNTATNRFEPVALDLGEASDQLILVAFGTGFRQRTSLGNVSATIGGVAADVLFAGPQGGLVGVDQLNVRIPRSLAGRGSVDVVLTVDGKRANAVTIQIK